MGTSVNILLLSGVVMARPVGEHRSCWESDLLPAPGCCCSTPVPLGGCSFDTSNLKEEHGEVQCSVPDWREPQGPGGSRSGSHGEKSKRTYQVTQGGVFWATSTTAMIIS